ncbi:MAG: Ltp family lipoprotein [Corynebacterium sp.]|nr:Ltp family lipoprotein [Corynebacterium sp.]
MIAVLIGLIALLLVGGIAVFGAAYYLINEQKSSTTSTTSLAPTNLTPVPITPPNAIDSTVKPGEKNNDKEAALESAKVLAELDYSKQGMFEALINPNIENYTEEAAQYAIDNLNEDWKQNALEKAKIYVEHLGLEKEEIYEQLTSEYGDKFTPEEARYAVDNL